MANLTTCDAHDDTIIVYDVSRGYRKCPLCLSETEVEKLEVQIEGLKDDIESLKDEMRVAEERNG